MRSQLVGPALALVRASAAGEAGVRALVDRFALPRDAESAAEVVLPLAALRDLLDAASSLAGESALGIRLAERLPRGAYGVLEYSCRSAPDIRGALTRIVRYIGLLNELVVVSLEERGGVATVEQRVPSDPACVGRHGNEFFVVMLLLRMRALSGGSLVPDRVWFAHAPPGDAAPLVAALGTRHIEWRTGSNGLTLPSEALALPLTSSDPPLLHLLDRQAEQSLAGTEGRPAIVSLARRRVRDTLADAPTLESVASALKMSPRSLQRRLHDEGLTFAKLVEDTRKEIALASVRDARRPLGEIAFALGYAELSPFLRAFKRWTGRTPSEVRGAP